MPLAAAAAMPEPIVRLLRQVAHHAAPLGLEAALVGGAVRDLLLGHAPTDIDVAVGGRPADVSALAELLGRSLGGIMEGHAAFGTASLRLHGEAIRLDLAMRRREFYPRPGALPRVEPGTWEEDLARRDFTINAMAWPLAFLAAVAEPTPVQVWPRDLLAVPEALPDLSRGLVRVLHDGSFCDDPTRLMRAARTAARLGFRLEPGTRALAEQAMHGGALDTVTPRRIAQEVRLTAREGTAWTAFALLDGLGVWKTLLPQWGVGVGAGPQGRLLEEGLAALKQVKAVRAEPWRARLLAWLDGGTTPHTASGAEAEAGAEAVVS
ncbi:MAG: hypothetical protein M1602_06995, partial [Firmicutes bacterium]|nr:hypothetical protein [Bacillota bacterium]